MPSRPVGRSQGASGTAPPLVGRSAEWSSLLGALAAAGGRSRTVLIDGEAGIGKTRLVEELLDEVRRSGFSILAGRADELEQMRPFAAVADALATGAEGVGEGSSILALLREAASTGAGDVELIDELLDLVEEMAAEGPAAVVFEDLHWADAATISAVRLIGRRLAYLPLLVVGTYRPHPVPPELSRLVDAVSRENGTIIALQRLSDTDAVALAAQMLGAEVGPGLSRVVGTSGGNPLFVTELINALQDEGGVRVANGVADTEPGPLPATLRLTILRRLSFLPADTLEVLRPAAVLGSGFGLEELAALTGRPTPELAAALEPAIRSKILGDRGPAARFRHDLIQEAIYEDIPGPVRASMHVEAARTLKGLSVSPSRVAGHLLRGVHAATPEGIALLIEVGSSLQYVAPALSIGVTQRAVDLLGHRDPRAQGLRVQMLMQLAAVGRGSEAIALSEDLLRTRPDPSTDAALRFARFVVKAREGRSRECIPELLEVADGTVYPDGARRFARSTAAGCHFLCADVDAAGRLAERSLAEARASGDHQTLMASLLVLGGVAAAEGFTHEGLARWEEALAIDTAQRTFASHPHVQVALGLLLSDRFDEAVEALRTGRRRAREAGEIPSVASYAHMAALIAYIEAAWDDAVAEAETGLRLVDEGAGSSMVASLSSMALSQVLLRRGALEASERVIARMRADRARKDLGVFADAVEWWESLQHESRGDTDAAAKSSWASWEMGAPFRYIFSSRFVAPDAIRLALAAGDRDRALAIAEAAEEGARRAHGVSSAAAAALRCRGILEDDADSLVAAVDAYRGCRWVLARAQAAEDAAHSLARGNLGADARGLFEEALEVYEGAGAAREIARCAARMREVGMRPAAMRRRRPVSGWASLTPKERDVARMAAGGLTNPEIAERLFVSKYTVMTHLSHVFQKLGISSRVELAAAAAGEPTQAEDD